MRKRKNRNTLSNALTCVLMVAMAFMMTGFAYAKKSNTLALTEPESNALCDVTEPTVKEQVDLEPIESVVEEQDFVKETEVVETEPMESEPTDHIATEDPEPTREETREEIQEATAVGCNHFWRREYEPETATKEGYLIDSCLYCAEWYVVEVIPPYGE
jgi:hypothetical protein